MDRGLLKAGLVGSLVWLSMATAYAGERVYGAEPMESHWQVAGEELACRLDHEVPQFGQARFVQDAGTPLRFELHMLRPQRSGTVALRAIPPEWHSGSLIAELGEAQLAPGRAVLQLDAQQAEGLIAELEEGVYPAIFFPESAPGRGGVSVVISGVRFRDALDGFLACRAKLLKVDVATLRERTLRFGSNQATLKDADYRALNRLARYASNGDVGRKVVIEARTDDRGSARYNDRLARRRAEAVRDYLVAQGVMPRQIQISALGERKPVASNRSATGRAQNRRVDVRVVD